MRRRLALQTLASSVFGSAMITAARSESSGLRPNGNAATDLLSALSDVHQEPRCFFATLQATNCESSQPT